MKKALLISLAAASAILLTSCGGEKNETAAETYIMNNDASYSRNAEADYGYGEEDNDTSGEESYNDYGQCELKAIDRQMLVYSCEMSIDVLEFDEAVDKIHELIDNYGGFIESENYSDGGNSSKWQYSDNEKWKNLYATIRIPSAKYDDFCKDAESVGDMRRKNSSVQNLTTEYSDLKTTLSIYEAKEQRYLDILADTKNEQDAIAIESELTDIQIEIAKIKTRMNNIENDVAYSYINLTLNEVREYSEEPVFEKTDTFGQRLKGTLTKTWSGFLDFLEGLLFLIIGVLPYLIFIGIIVFVFVKLILFFVKLSEKHNAKKNRQNIQPAVQPAQPAPPANKIENTPDVPAASENDKNSD